MSEYAGLVLVQPGGGVGYTVYTVKRVLYHKRSRYQDVMVVEVDGLGKALVLDGLLQSSEVDEYIYHEALVHPAMTVHPNPQRVLILGGGEGATLREVLKHKTVKEAVMVDIDADVIEVARKYLPEWHQGAFDDPRARVVVMDGLAYVEEAVKRGEHFDVVVMDLTDPYGSEVARKLYAPEFFEKLYQLVGDEGIVVTQAGSSFFYPKAYEMVLESARRVFREINEYGVFVPSFAYVNNFIACSQKYKLDSIVPEEVDRRLRERGVKTRFYDGRRHLAMVYMGAEPRRR